MKIQCSQFSLRPLQISDKQALAKSANNRKIWLNVSHRLPYPYSEKDAVDFINFVQQQEKQNVFAIDIKGEVIGMIGCEPQEGIFQLNAELGYWLAEPFWTKGIITEAIQHMCYYTFSESNITRISAQVFAYNKASIRVLEKNDFKQEGVLRKAVFKDGLITDLHIFGKLKGD